MKDSFCAVPWVNFSLDTDGSIRPCCKFKHRVAPSEITFPMLSEGVTLEEAWNSEAMVKLREAFLRGEKPNDCSSCYDEEKAGMESLRQTFMLFRQIPNVDFSNVRPSVPLALDLKLSNHCNLKCRICGPIASNSFLMELREIGQLEAQYEENRVYYRSRKITDKPSSLQQFRKWLEKVVHVEIYGGEPFLCPETLEVENIILESGRQSQISMIYNTNITTYSQERVEKWKAFKRVQLNLSLDDIGDRLHYQRYPADWNVIEQNMKSYHESGHPNTDISIFCSVSLFNIWYLEDFLDYCNKNLPRFQILLNIVHDPHLRIANLPDTLKLKVEARLAKIIDDKKYGNCSPEQITAVINYLKNPCDKVQLNNFVRRLRFYDEVRKQNFRDYFPKYAEALLGPVQTPI